jgi:hypothetical protein
MGYKSEKKVIRYLSYISLGFATGFKITPAILALLILRNRNNDDSINAYKEFGMCAIIVALLFFVPFIFTDGTFMMLLDNIQSLTERMSLMASNISQLVESLSVAIGFSGETASLISYTLIGTLMLLTSVIVLFDREMKFWKVVALLSCTIILGLGVSIQYLVIYMTIPILYFLSTEIEMTKENKFYTICFAMTMVLIPGIVMFTYVENSGSLPYPGTIVALIQTIFVIVVTIAILIEGIGRIYHNRSGGRDRGCEPLPLKDNDTGDIMR